MKSRKALKEFSLQLGPGVTTDVIAHRLHAFIERAERRLSSNKRVSRKIRKCRRLQQRNHDRSVACS